MGQWIKQLLGRKSSSKTKPSRSSRTSTGHHNNGAKSGANSGAKTVKYRAAVIYSRGECCDAAKRIAGQKFLAAHAPQLPLGGCSQPERCQCRYKHLPDRREELRRDTDHGLPNRNYVVRERRVRRDRRRDRHPPMSA